MRPGGWFEVAYIDYLPISKDQSDSVQNSVILSNWEDVDKGLVALGVDTNIAREGRLAEKLIRAEFKNVVEKEFQVPFGPWPKERPLQVLGSFLKTTLIDAYPALAMIPLTRGLGWRHAKADLYIAEVKRNIMEEWRKHEMYFPLRVVYGQKEESKARESRSPSPG